MADLLPCPFCGELPMYVGPKGDRVKCHNRDCWNTGSYSITAWNTRHDVTSRIQDIFAEFEDDPVQCLQIVGEYIGLLHHNASLKGTDHA